MSEATFKPLRVLITNNTLGGRAGSELYVRDLALALMRRGHLPVAYSSQLGEVAEELRRATVPVIDDLNALNTPPDVIHGQHHLDAVTAMLHFPRVPALYICHGWLPWEEVPPALPAIGRYLAVDDLCLERLLTTPGIPPERCEVLYNFVDLQRFKQRPALPERPRSALIFSNYAAGQPALEAMRNACHRAGIEQVDVVGSGSGNSVKEPARILGNYDLVFAKARAAIEAMASGCAVMVADQVGLAGMVRSDNLAELRRLNFGVRSMQRLPLDEDTLLAQIQRYDSQDARRVSDWIRQDADMERVVDRWLQIYAQLIDESANGKGTSTPESQLRAGAAYLRWLAPTLKSQYQTAHHAGQLQQSLTHAEGQLRQLNEHLQGCGAQQAAQEQHSQHLQARMAEQEQQHQQLQAMLAEQEQHNRQLQSQLSEWELRNQQWQHQATAQEQRLRKTESDLAELLDSRAWRALAPYRSLRRWLRRG
ncbi:glycosyltransferase [Pseudomonas nitroreducens]|uniref:glycosyltransferase n=1 Tax=Pseudomonas nitroreducens TaxID=46680 RepID=UPI00209D044E|nr:glycosyltransferase [Pseudomonas nitroreducens]MCP1625612.1 putative coiled-coil protein SlyX [Pseudomonas nitroreducens]